MMPKIKPFLIDSLSEWIEYHQNGEFEKMSLLQYEKYDQMLIRNQSVPYRYFIALHFWDSWIDAKNHEWQYYPDIKQDEWPKYAAVIIEAVKQEKEIDNVILNKNFDLRKK